ncbi:M1 family metallopeptidase [Caldiplasma sukawensis]
MEKIKEYKIYYKIDTDKLQFQGTEKIYCTVKGDFELNCADMEIEDVAINNRQIMYEVDEKNQSLKIVSDIKGEVEIDIKFKGKISDGLNGIYYSKEKDFVFITTQFEATGARYAFPCMDDPSFKAEFSITLDIPEDYDGISNMPTKKQEVRDKRKIIEFEKTPRMSTYLLYIGVSKFDRLEKKYGSKSVGLVAAKNKFKLNEKPVDMAIDTINFFENYFGIEYKLPKEDLIAVPEFAFGAMENWGAITFREIELIVTDTTSSMILKRIDEVISHELAHQWFGDLVTMKWWDDLWLNESFATFMSYKAVDHKHPEWDIFAEMVGSETSGAMTGDSLRNTHPIHVEVKSPEEISQIFDEISYGKGGSILRMMEYFVGKENFRKGVSEYLREHEFGNAVASDLWNSIGKVSKMPVDKIMSAWINKKGYPVLYCEIIGDKISIRQSRFLLDGTKDSEIWPIPITVVRNGSTESVLMENQEISIPLKDFKYLNNERSGFYRVRYSNELLEEVLKHKNEMDKFARFGLISDYYAFFQAGEIKLNELMSLLSVFTEDQEYIVVDVMISVIMNIYRILEPTNNFLEFATNYMRNQLNKMGEISAEEGINRKVLRGRLKTSLSIIDTEFSKENSQHINEYFKLDADSRPSVLISYSISSNDENKLLEILEKSDSDEDRVNVVSALSYLKGDQKLNRILEMILEGRIKKQDSIRFIISCSLNRENRKFIITNMEMIYKTVDQFFKGTGYSSRMLEVVIPYCGLENESAVREFSSKFYNPENSKGIEKGLEYLTIFKRMSGK